MTATAALHSRIGASSMHRWAECPGSVKLSETVPKHTSAFAEEGTEAHELAEKFLHSFKRSTVFAYAHYDDEMVENVKVYVDYVIEKFSVEKGSKLIVEHKFDLSSLHPGLFGTADAVIYHPKLKLLRVIDLKYGAGVPVEVKNNPQLLYYGLGAMISTEYPVDTIELTIVQPRLNHVDGPIRSQKLTTLELMDFSADLIEFAKKTEDPNAPLRDGRHCKFCPAKAVCPQLSKTALEKAKEEFRDLLPYSPEKLAETLDALDRVEAWAKGVRAFAYAEAEHGRCPPGYKLVKKRATRKWKSEDEAVKYLEWQAGLKEDQLFEPRQIKSVAQIEKQMGKERKTESAYLDLISQESSGNKLVHESEPGEPVKKLTALEQFIDVETVTIEES